MNTLHQQRQFLSSSTTIIGGGTQCNKPFNPPKEKPKTAKIYLNSQDRIYGTNQDASFKINMPCDFTASNLGITLNNFIPSMPTGTEEGIVQVNMVGVENPYSYSSSNQTTHRSLGMFPVVGGGAAREYPPAPMTSATTTFSNLPFGNGTYTQHRAWFATNPLNAFDKNDNTLAENRGGYNASTGLHTSGFSTTASGCNIVGDWMDLAMPFSIQPSSYTVNVAGDTAKLMSEYAFCASSNNGTSWELLHYSPYSNRVSWCNYTHQINTSNVYNRFRLCAVRAGNNNWGSFRDFLQLGEFRIFGYSNSQLGYTTQTITLSNATTSPANAFDYNSNTAWTTGTAYNASTGLYTGCNFTTVDGSNMMGEWIELRTPESIILQSYVLAGDSNWGNSSLRSFTLAASSNGTTYTKIETIDGLLVAGGGIATTISTSNLPTTTPYNRFRLLTHGVGSNDAPNRTYAGIVEWRLTGYSNVANVGNLNEWFNVPPVAMTSNTNVITGQTAGNGLYEASSSFGGNVPYMFFDKLNPNLTSAFSYDDATGWYNSNTTTPVLISGTTSNMSGEWVQINTPCPITIAQLDLSSYNVPQTNCPSTISLVGANTNGVFNHIFTMCNLTNWGTGTDSTNRWYRVIYASGGSAPYSFDQTAFPTNFYQNWRLIVHRVGNSSSNASGRNYLNLSEMLLRGYASNNPYSVPPSAMTATSTTFSNQLFGNGTYTTTSSSNIITTITSNNIPPAGRIGQSNLNAEIITTDRTLFHRPITLRLSSPTGMDLSTMCNWSAEITITERP